jgi:hypothetical protein
MFAMAAARKMNLPLFELARVLVRLNHVARVIVNADRYSVWAPPGLARKRILLSDIGRAFPIRQRAAQSVVIE